MSDLFAVKMRASRDGSHVSGAERIVPLRRVGRTLAALAARALSHDRARPDALNLKAEALAESPLRLPALPVSTVEVPDVAAGWREVETALAAAGFARVAEIRALFRETYGMRGAMLLHADTLERLEPNPERGVRATNMDGDPSPGPARKNHFAEALTLASKVLAAPGIVGEICVSDDPNYITGYVATKSLGYRRITKLKEPGDPSGGRIFLFRGTREEAAKAVAFLERTPVVVVQPRPASSLSAELAAIERAGLTRTLRVFPPTDQPLVSFASNDYLSLASDPRVKAAAAQAALDYGAGTGASRLVTGTQPPHVRLERHLAAFKGTADAMVFATGYMANVGAITALVGKDDLILSDALNHASIIDGCRLSGAEVSVYPHLDLDELERRLEAVAHEPLHAPRRILVVSDGVFSMDGDLLDLPRFLGICRRHNAFAMIDEAHSLGVVGPTGHGLGEAFGCLREGCLSGMSAGHHDAHQPADPNTRQPTNSNTLILMGTLSKALGSQGGYIAGSRTLIAYLRQKARSFIFSTAPNAAAMAAADAALSILEAEPGRVARLRTNVQAFRAALPPFCQSACQPADPALSSAIVPILVGDERRAVRLAAALEKAGFLVPAIRYPTVARGAARLRAAISFSHDETTLLAAAHAIGQLLKAT